LSRVGNRVENVCYCFSSKKLRLRRSKHAIEDAVELTELRVLLLEELVLFPHLQNSLLERVLPDCIVDRWLLI